MDPLTIKILAVLLTAVLSAVAWKIRCLTPDGAVASFVAGAVVAVFGSIGAFVLMTAFTAAGFAATKARMAEKIAAGLQEGQLGERTWRNVMGVGVPPIVVSLIYYLTPMDDVLFAVLFISTIAVAGADTIASEIGIRDPDVYMITTFEKVEPGINGGVSRTGTAVSTMAALLIALLGWVLFFGTVELLVIVPFAMGVLGNLLDSVFGAVLENPGHIDKYVNNGSTAFIAAAVGGGICIALGA